MKMGLKLIVVIFNFIIIGLFGSCASTGQNHIVENNHLNHSGISGEKITVQIHRVFGPWYHASMRINLDSDLLMEKYGKDQGLVNTDKNGVKYITLGAGPKNIFFNRKLKAELNRPRDINEKTHIKVETHNYYLTSENIDTIFDIFYAYSNDLRYAYFPENKEDKFNSNSFITGILKGMGLEAPVFSTKYRIPGYNKPIPLKMESKNVI